MLSAGSKILAHLPRALQLETQVPPFNFVMADGSVFKQVELSSLLCRGTSLTSPFVLEKAIIVKTKKV